VPNRRVSVTHLESTMGGNLDPENMGKQKQLNIFAFMKQLVY